MANKKKGRQRRAAGQRENRKQHNSPTTSNRTSPQNTTKKHESTQNFENSSKVSSTDPVVGLMNLGNTCFFNSIMQNLIQTPMLHKLLKREIKLAEAKHTSVIESTNGIPSLNYVPAPLGKFSIALSAFFDAIQGLKDQSNLPNNNTKRQTNRNKTYNPRCLFNEICNKNARFRGFQQQDSQELFHSLLDSVKVEEIKRKKLGVLQALKLEKAKAKDVPDEVRKKVRHYGIEISENEDTIVEQVFGGKLISSVLCDGCGTVTGITEPFHDLSLPINDVKSTNTHHTKLPIEASDESGEEINQENLKTKNNSSKRMQKKARKQSRRNRHQNYPKTENGDTENSNKSEEIEKFADSIAEDALCNALKLLAINSVNDEISDGTNKTPNISNESDCGDTVVIETVVESDSNHSHSKENGDVKILKNHAKMKGGAIVSKNLNLPADDIATDDITVNDITVNDITDSKDEDKLDNCDEAESPASLHDTTTDKDSSDDKTQKISLFDTPMRHYRSYTFSEFYCKLPESLTTRQHTANQKCSVQSCLYQFTMPEMLSGTNKFGCDTCTKRQTNSSKDKKTIYCSASKQMLINQPPNILTIHLKRFQQVGYNLRKVNKHVAIPTLLDVAPFCTTQCKSYADEDDSILYDLYGIVEHSGSLTRGHYTAYVKVRPATDEHTAPSGEWFHISDNNVSKTSQAKALSSNAYLLFYERLK